MGVSQRDQQTAAQSKRKRAYSGAVGGSPTRSTKGSGLWGDVDPALVLRAIRRIAAAGAGLLIGATRDGTSAAVTLFYEDPSAKRGADSRVRFYPKSVEEAELLMEDLEMWAEDPQALNGLSYFFDNM